MAEDGRLLIFPVSKSTQLLMCNGSGFARFSDATSVRYDDLATWEGFYDAAGKFYDWSGKPFCALDYPIRAVELCAMERGRHLGSLPGPGQDHHRRRTRRGISLCL